MESTRKDDSQNPGELLSSMFAHEIANSLHGLSALVCSMERHFHKTGDVDKSTGELLRLITEEINRLTLLLEDFPLLGFLAWIFSPPLWPP